jgi:hypothetical protein
MGELCSTLFFRKSAILVFEDKMRHQKHKVTIREGQFEDAPFDINFGGFRMVFLHVKA